MGIIMYKIFLFPLMLALTAMSAQAATFNAFTSFQRSTCDAGDVMPVRQIQLLRLAHPVAYQV
jgi:hypothetical protein